MKTWIVIAGRSGARIHEKTSLGPTREVERIDHPQGRQRDSEIDSAAAGRAFDRNHMADGRHSLEPQECPKARLAAIFAREVAARVEHARLEGRFERLVLVAEPQFLGLLRAWLDRATLRLIDEMVPHDFVQLPDAALAGRLARLSIH